jgi:hypothetical protein
LTFVDQKNHVDVTQRLDRLNRDVIGIARAHSDNRELSHSHAFQVCWRLHFLTRVEPDASMLDGGSRKG